MQDDVFLAIVISLSSFALAVIFLIFVFVSGWGPRCLHSVLSRLVRCFKKRKKWSWSKIDDLVFLGSVPRELAHLEELRKEGVAAVVTLNEAWELKLSSSQIKDELGMSQLHLPTPDYFAPSQSDIVAAVNFMDEHLTKGRGIYVHCNGGRGRSAVCVLAWLIAKRGMAAEDAYDFVRSKRRIANMQVMAGLHKQWIAIKRFERNLKRGGQRSEAAAVGKGQVVPVEDEG
eukprot:TRINITY_DN4492_c0_g1_i1.p1 TRINITY_DN4492_c0_g1~~TRINITY_DN4492_c0_g1_i1.p1  ORF type:complete len:230 (-),score=50.24 TRINITY_DN4492_c0_g1_i1:36-725(-)